MLYSEVLGAMAREGDAWTAAVPEDWKQGRSAFGGLQSAFALRAMRALVPADVPLRLHARVLRAGKNAVHAEATIRDGDQALCVVIGVFGTARPSRVQRLPEQPAAPGQKPVAVPYVEGLSPE